MKFDVAQDKGSKPRLKEDMRFSKNKSFQWRRGLQQLDYELHTSEPHYTSYNLEISLYD